MSPATAQQLEKEISQIKHELTVLKAAMLATDPEGIYKPAFVKDVKDAAKSKPTKKFSPGSFLN